MAHAGDILADRWILAEKIDAGAMGEIFRARHRDRPGDVAVKVLMADVFARDKGAVERFLRESRIAARLQHTNVVRVVDYGLAADGRPFLVMELLHGESLAKRLHRTARLPPAEALDIVRGVASALDRAHGEGIVHRDLKPENIFLSIDAEGAVTVKVLDFGVAKFTDSLSDGAHATTSNTLVGTPRYMSPEQARSSRELDGRSDLWALGMLAYEMLAGRHPFEGEAIAELLVAILTHRIEAPSEVNPALPASVDAWMQKALARARGDRFSSGRDMADALALALEGHDESAWRVGSSAITSGATREEARAGGTLRVKRPALRALEPTPEATAESTSKLPAAAVSEPTPGHGIAVAAPPAAVVDATRATGRSRLRASWWIALPMALVAGLGIVAIARLVRHEPAAPPVSSAHAPPERPDPAPVLPAPAPPAPAPPAPAAPSPAALEPPAPQELSAEGDDPPSRGGRHRRHHHTPTGSDREPRQGNRREGATTQPPTMYDPTGI
ncbi:MAG: serine/threonine-protein kinase [Polyangiales bacterium]